MDYNCEVWVRAVTFRPYIRVKQSLPGSVRQLHDIETMGDFNPCIEKRSTSQNNQKWMIFSRFWCNNDNF